MRVWGFVFFLVFCIAGCDDDSGRKSSSRAWAGPDYVETYNGSSSYYPKITMDGQGNAIAVWTCRDLLSSTYRIWANRYEAGYGWGEAALIETYNTASATAPSVAVDSDGNAVAVWQQDDGYVYNIMTNCYR